jgi:hypothetical protein
MTDGYDTLDFCLLAESARIEKSMPKQTKKHSSKTGIGKNPFLREMGSIELRKRLAEKTKEWYDMLDSGEVAFRMEMDRLCLEKHMDEQREVTKQKTIGAKRTRCTR